MALRAPDRRGAPGRPKSRRHRERLSAAGRLFWARAHAALAAHEQTQSVRCVDTTDDSAVLSEGSR